MQSATDLQRTLTATLRHQGPLEAIWTVENEIAKKNRKIEAVEEIYRISDLIISDADIICAQKISYDQLDQFHQMMLHNSNMEPEEWILAITIISSLYCTHAFARRRGLATQERELADAIQSLKDGTSDFQDEHFKRALAYARRRNPNPLPSFI